MLFTHRLLGLAAAVAILGSMIAPASAQTIQEQVEQREQQFQERVEQFEETKQQFQENRDAAVEQRCDIATTRIDLWTTRYENNQSLYQRTFEKFDEIADQVVERAQASGKDTAEFEAAVAELERLADVSRTEYDQLIQDLEATKAYACGESEGAFKDALQTSRQQLLDTRQAVLDARLYYQSTVRPAAQALLQS